MDKVGWGFAWGQGAMCVMGELCVLCLLVTQCVCCTQSIHSKATGFQEGANADCVWQNSPSQRTLQVRVDEKNLRFDTDLHAKTYLFRKLRALLAKSLVQEGFRAKWARTRVQSVKPCDWQVGSYEKRIYGTGREAGLIKQVVLWDASADLRLDLDDSDIEELLSGLLHRRIQSLLGALDLVDKTKRLRQLSVPKVQFDQFMRTLSSKWLAVLQEKLQIQLQTSATTQHKLVLLEQVATHLHRYRKIFPDQTAVAHALATIQPAFRKIALVTLRSVPMNAKHTEDLKAVIHRLETMVQSLFPDLVSYLWRDLEINWRNRLLALEKHRLSFSAVRDEFVVFWQLFPEAEASSVLRKRFLTRFEHYLTATSPRDLDALHKMQKDVLLYQKLSQSKKPISRVTDAMQAASVRILKAVQARDLDEVEKIREVLRFCKRFHLSEQTLKAIEERLDNMSYKLVSLREDKSERQALSSLEFIYDWDKLAVNLPWNQSRQTWINQKTFRQLWHSGHESGATCRCSLDSDEPCRAFKSPEGVYEVVAKFYNDRLAGLDLCQVNAGQKLDAFYRFFERRYQKMHNNRQAKVFVAGLDAQMAIPVLRFQKGDSLQVTLERQAQSCTVRYRDLTLLQEKKQDEQQELMQLDQSKRARRQARVQAGFRVGACVRFDCKPICSSEGVVHFRHAQGYHVTVTKHRHDPRLVGTRILKKGEQLFDCQP